MFCPNCGRADQKAESFCRKCGVFLADFDKAARGRKPPSEHINANMVLSAMTIVASLTLAILLYAILAFRPDTHPLIYVTAGVLIAIGAWHVQSLVRTLMLRKQLKEWGRLDGKTEAGAADASVVPDSLAEADLSSYVSASVTEETTRNLSGSGRH